MSSHIMPVNRGDKITKVKIRDDDGKDGWHVGDNVENKYHILAR